MIKPFRFFSQKVLPLVYDNSLSYYEVLDKVVYKLNQVITDLNELETSISGLVDSMIGDKLAALKKELEAEINNVNTTLNNEIAKTNVNLSTLTDRVVNVEDTLNNVMEELATVEQDLTAALNLLKDKINAIEHDYKLADANIIIMFNNEVQRLEDEIQHMALQDVTVINPVTDQRDDLQNTLDDMMYALGVWRLKAGEYDNIGLTAGEYDAKNLTAWNYDFLGKWYLIEKPMIYGYVDDTAERAAGVIYNALDPRIDTLENCCTQVQQTIADNAEMFSPFTGEVESVKDVIYQIFAQLRGEALKAQEYDDLGLTATEYAAYALTAYMYDWQGKLLLH